MKITYDSKVDAAYIYFVEGAKEVTTQRLTEDIAVDYGPDGTIVGLEILSAKEYLSDKQGKLKLKVENMPVVHS